NWVPTLATNATWYWRGHAPDRKHPSSPDPPPAWACLQKFIMSGGAPPPAPGLFRPANGFGGTSCSNIYSMSFSWNAAAPAAEYLVQVSTDPTFSTVSYQSSWSTNTSWTTTVATTATYHWRVHARDPLSLAVGPWSPGSPFTITDT